MDLELTQKVELTEAQVQMIIGKFIRDHFSISDEVVTVQTNCRIDTVGHQMNESKVAVFKGMTVTIEPKKGKINE